MAAAWGSTELVSDDDGDMQFVAASAMDLYDEVNAESTAPQDAVSATADLETMLDSGLGVLESERQMRENDRLNFEAMIRTLGMYQRVNAAQLVYVHVRRSYQQERLTAGTKHISIMSMGYSDERFGVAGESTLGHELAELLRPMDLFTAPRVELELFGDLQIGCFREFAFASYVTHISIIKNSTVNVLDFSNVGPAVAVEVRDCPNLIRVRSRGLCNLYGCWPNVVCTRNLTPFCEESLNLSVEQEDGFRQRLVESYASVFGHELVQCRNYYGLIDETFEIVPAADGDENAELIGDALARVANFYTTEKKWTLKLTNRLSIGSLATICAAFRDWSIVVANNIDLKVVDTRNTGVRNVTVRLCAGLRYAVASSDMLFTAEDCPVLTCIVSPRNNNVFARAQSCAMLTSIIDVHRVECEFCLVLARLPRRVGPGSRIVVGPACPLVDPPVMETNPVFWHEATLASYLEQHPQPLDGVDLPRWAKLENRVIGPCETMQLRVARRNRFFTWLREIELESVGSYVYNEMEPIPLIVFATRDTATSEMRGARFGLGRRMGMELHAFEQRQRDRGVAAIVSLRRRNGASSASSASAAANSDAALTVPPAASGGNEASAMPASQTVQSASMPYAPPEIERHILQFLLNPSDRPS